VFVVDHQGNTTTVKVTNNALQPVSVTSNKVSTTFAVSVNGAAWSNQPTTVNGALNGDSSVQSYGSFSLSGPGTQAISVTATDLFGNQVTITDQMRFNQAPIVTLVRGTTTSAQVVNLEQLVNVVDPDGDYPLIYQWSLGGGIGVNYTDGATYLGGPTSTWDPSAYHTAKFMQTGKNQSTTYPVILTVADAWGQGTVFSMNMVVNTTSSGTLYANEYWTGAVNLSGIVEVPAGLTLTLDGAAVTVNGNLSEASTPGSLAIVQGGIVVDSGGSLIVANSSGTSGFVSGADGYYWSGIQVSGTVQGSGLEVDQAERGFILLPGGSLSMTALNLGNNLIGIHLLGGGLNLNGGTLANNSEYGIKEDSFGSYVVRNMVFLNNGVGYYQLGKTGISTTELNAIPGNGGNQ